MFKAIIESKSHEGGLLASFTGSSPALGSIIVRVDDGTYIGKIDAVLGNTDQPIAHIAHLDRKMDANLFLGCEAQIRAKSQARDSNRKTTREYGGRERNRNNEKNKSPRYDKSRDDRRSSRQNFDRRDSRRRTTDHRSGNYRDARRGNPRDRQNTRRDGRSERHRGKEKKTFADNDWVCKKCSNVNFSFRKECNRCGEPKNDQSNRRDRQTRTEKPRAERNRSHDQPVRKFRKARGKSANHAHNRGPKPLNARSRRRNRDD